MTIQDFAPLAKFIYFLLFLSPIIYFIFFIIRKKRQLIAFEEEIFKSLKNIDRKYDEVKNILEKISQLTMDQSNVEAKTIIETIKSQNPNVPNFSLIIGSLESVKHILPSLNSNMLFNNYYDKIIELESELTNTINEKDQLISEYYQVVRDPFSSFFYRSSYYPFDNRQL